LALLKFLLTMIDSLLFVNLADYISDAASFIYLSH